MEILGLNGNHPYIHPFKRILCNLEPHEFQKISMGLGVPLNLANIKLPEIQTFRTRFIGDTHAISEITGLKYLAGMASSHQEE